MNDHVFHQPPKESKRAALILSVLVHLILVGALFYGVQWSNNTGADAGTMMEVEVWNGKPPVVRQPPTPPPPPPPSPVVDTPPPPPPPPVKRPETVEKTPEVTPDILVKDEEAKRKKAEEKLKLVEAKRKEDEKRKLDEDKKRKDDELKRKENEKRKEDELKRKQDIDNKLKAESQEVAKIKNAQARAAEKDRINALLNAEMSGAARNKGLADYHSRIQGKIRGNVILPVGIQGNPEAVFDVVQLPTGEILSVKLQKSSGNAALDAAIDRAIWKSSPLPLPDAKENFKRELEIVYRPREE